MMGVVEVVGIMGELDLQVQQDEVQLQLGLALQHHPAKTETSQ